MTLGRYSFPVKQLLWQLLYNSAMIFWKCDQCHTRILFCLKTSALDHVIELHKGEGTEKANGGLCALIPGQQISHSW